MGSLGAAAAGVSDGVSGFFQGTDELYTLVDGMGTFTAGFAAGEEAGSGEGTEAIGTGGGTNGGGGDCTGGGGVESTGRTGSTAGVAAGEGVMTEVAPPACFA
jgi:hypothetical protein